MRFKTKFLVLIFVLFLNCLAFSKNITVIPFQNINEDKEKNWIGAGFSETLTTKLVKVKEINVLERENLSKILEEIKFQYTGAVDEKTAVEKGKMYGVDVMVFGSFQVVGDKLKVNARFVDVQTRKVIDTAEANGNISDIFKLQDEIAFSLIDSLKIVLAEKEKEEIKINPTENLTAYQWYNKGNEANGLSQYDKAIEYYTKAIELDPNLVDVYYERGDVYRAKFLYDNAISDLVTAIELKPKDAKIYYKLGDVYCGKGIYDSAIEELTKAIKLNPNLADSYDYDNLGFAYYNKEQYGQAIENYSKAINKWKNDSWAYYQRRFAYYKMGMKKLCIADWKKATDSGVEEARKNLKEYFNIDY